MFVLAVVVEVRDVAAVLGVLTVEVVVVLIGEEDDRVVRRLVLIGAAALVELSALGFLPSFRVR